LELEPTLNKKGKANRSYVVSRVRTRTRENTGTPINSDVFAPEMDNKKTLGKLSDAEKDKILKRINKGEANQKLYKELINKNKA